LYTLEIFQGKFNLTYFGDLIANFKIQLSGWWQPLNEIMESLKDLMEILKVQLL
jgi:hypothetical protein